MNTYTKKQLAQIEEYGRLHVDVDSIRQLLTGKDTLLFVEQLLADICTAGSDACNAYRRGMAQRQLELERSLYELGLGDAADRKAYEETITNRKVDAAIKDNFGLE